MLKHSTSILVEATLEQRLRSNVERTRHSVASFNRPDAIHGPTLKERGALCAKQPVNPYYGEASPVVRGEERKGRACPEGFFPEATGISTPGTG